MKHRVPEGKAERAGIAGAAALKLGIGQLGHVVKRPFLSPTRRQEAREALDDKNAAVLFAALSQLRGTALKAAQMLSMEVDLLPEAYRRELEKSCHRVPALNRVLVRKALMAELGAPPEELFQRFEPEAFAAASLGQVHAATLHDGRAVAVKIQYPGIAVAIDSDMVLLRQLARGMPNSRMVLKSLAEIHARLREEVDYVQEAANQRWFGTHLAVDGVRIPLPVDDRCAARVLTTELAPGLHPGEWLKRNPSQAVRDAAAQRLYDAFVHSALDLRRLHADPNPGNYLIAPEGTLTLIDFGCVKHMSARFAEGVPRVVAAYRDDDPDALFAAYGDLGMRAGVDRARAYQDILRPFGQWMLEPMREEYYDFGLHADYTARAKAFFQRLGNLSWLDGLADEFLFFDRTLYGLCRLFELMGARVRIRHHWSERS